MTGYWIKNSFSEIVRQVIVSIRKLDKAGPGAIRGNKACLLSKTVYRVLLILTAMSVFSGKVMANDTYDASSGIVHMPVVAVGSDTYEVTMQHLGDLVFQVTSAESILSSTESGDTYDGISGILVMPRVIVGEDVYEVEMIHMGDLVFGVTNTNILGDKVTRQEFPVFAFNGLDNPAWEEYANFPGAGGETTDYFLKMQSLTSVDENGSYIDLNSGERHVLSEDGDAAVAADGSLLIFQTYVVEKITNAEATEFTETVQWNHMELTGYSFTADSIGQKIGFWEKASAGAGLWKGYEFSEYGTQTLDLETMQAQILATGKAIKDITEADVPGFSAYAEVRFGGDFFYNSDGSSKQWYIVRKNDSTGNWVMSAEDWRNTSFNFQFHNFVGFLHAYIPGGYQINDDWNTDVLTWFPVQSFDNSKGILEVLIGGNEAKPLYIYLDQDLAQARRLLEQASAR